MISPGMQLKAQDMMVAHERGHMQDRHCMGASSPVLCRLLAPLISLPSKRLTKDTPTYAMQTSKFPTEIPAPRERHAQLGGVPLSTLNP